MDIHNQNMNNNINFMNNPNLYAQNINNVPGNMQMHQNNFNPLFQQGMMPMNPQFNMMQMNAQFNMMQNMNMVNQEEHIITQDGNIEYEGISLKDIKLFDLNNLTNKQLYLINEVIKFYLKNDNIYMNFENPIQILYILNFIEAKIDKCKYDNEYKIEDPLYYIKEPKKQINFINTDYKIYKVNIPINITKFDLYTIARYYKTNKLNDINILLLYKDNILNNDESSIDSISNNDFIKIIDIRNYQDNSYFNHLFYNDKIKTNYVFVFSDGKKQNLVLPTDIKISQLLKAFYLKNGLEYNSYKLIYNSLTLSPNDEQKFYRIGVSINIFVNYVTNYPYTFGKIIQVHITYTDKRVEDWIFGIGLLNSINYIISKNESRVKRKVKTLSIKNLIIKRDDQRTLLSLGITKNFNCLIDFEN